MSRDTTFFLLRKLHSLTGVIPIGVFLGAHLFINSGALLGECTFTDGVLAVNGLPYLPYIEVFGIMVPLLFHGILGFWMAAIQARYNSLMYNYGRNWWYTLQRFTGVLLIAFLVWHVWDTVGAKVLGRLHLDEFYGHLAFGMSTNLMVLIFFVVGTLAASFHLANGLWGFCASWGILQSRRAQLVGGRIFGLVGLALCLAWFNIIFHFATGGANAIPVQEPPVQCGAVEFAPYSVNEPSEG